MLVCLTNSLFVRCNVGRLNFVWLKVPTLGGRLNAEVLYRTVKNEKSLVPILLLKVGGLQCRIDYFFLELFKYALANAIDWIVQSSCFCHRVIPSPVLLTSVVTMLSRSLSKCARQRTSLPIFIVSLKSSSSLSVHFHSVFFLITVSSVGLLRKCRWIFFNILHSPEACFQFLL